MTLKQYRTNVLLTLDQAINVIFLGGYPDETISSHAWRSKNNNSAWRTLYMFINWLFDKPSHCFDAYIAELDRKQNFKI